MPGTGRPFKADHLPPDRRYHLGECVRGVTLGWWLPWLGALTAVLRRYNGQRVTRGKRFHARESRNFLGIGS